MRLVDSNRLWHPFAAMGKVDGHELVLVRGDGCRIWDAAGTEYIDGTAGLWFANVGHGRGEIADAISEQLRTLAAHHIFGDHANEPALALARRLAELTPIQTRPSCSGAAVVKPSTPLRRSCAATGRSSVSRNGQVIVSRSHAPHGTNAYGTSLSGTPAIRDGYGTLIEDVAEVPYADV